MIKKILSIILASLSIGILAFSYSFPNKMPIWLLHNWSFITACFAVSSVLVVVNYKYVSDFVSESYIELIKIHWPGKQEVVQFTIITIIVLIIASTFIWILDGLLIKLIAFLTGQIG